MSRPTRLHRQRDDHAGHRAALSDPRHAEQRKYQALDDGLRSSSHPLEPGLQASMGAQLGHDFSRVRVHRDEQAARAAEVLHARAWTAGRDIVFRAGAYEPHTATGQQLLAHELTHVVQQDGREATPGQEIDLRPDEALEREARDVSRGTPAAPTQRSTGLLVQRADPEEDEEPKDDVPPQQDAGSIPDAAGPIPEAAGAQELIGDTAMGMSSDQAMLQVFDAVEAVEIMRDEIITVLMPAYRRAVDALDPEGAIDIARVSVAALGGIEKRERALEQRVAGWREKQAAADEGYGDAAVEGFYEVEADLESELEILAGIVDDLKRDMFVEIGPQVFREIEVARGVETPGVPSLDYIASEAATVAGLLATYHEINRLIGHLIEEPSDDDYSMAATLVEGWGTRPVNFRFLHRVLIEEGLWERLEQWPGEQGRSPWEVLAAVQLQAQETGNLTDVGGFDANQAINLLSGGLFGSEEAMQVYEMIMSAPVSSREALMEQLDKAGTFDTLLERLPWKAVQAMHNSISARGEAPSDLVERMRTHINENSGGESMTQLYERKMTENIIEGDDVGGWGWATLMSAHNALTFGSLGIHDAAYEGLQEGNLSPDDYQSAAVKSMLRAAVIGRVTGGVGMYGGAFGVGVGQGIGLGPRLSATLGGTIGGGMAGMGGQFTGDVFDQALMGADGFSSAEDYLLAGGLGGVTGGLMTGGLMAGAKYLPKSMQTMRQVYAQKYPELDNLLTRLRGSGTRTGLTMRVTSQELVGLAKSGLVSTKQLNDALARIGAVYRNERIDVLGETLTKIHPQSEIEQMYGPVDPATGKGTVMPTEPTSGGFVGRTSDITPQMRASSDAIRKAMGIDTAAYPKYFNPNDPLMEVVLRTSTELDVPLPQKNAPGTKLGDVDPTWHHVPGTGRTLGGVAEGEMPYGTPIEIIEIRPVGDPRPSYPPVGTKPYAPYSPKTPEIREIEAPWAGEGSGATTQPDSREE